MTAEIKKLLATCDMGLTGIRDRALLLIGYAGALRRSEIVAIEREHLTFGADGIRLLIPRSKTDGEGQGAEVGIPHGEKKETCPVRAMQAWLEASRCEFGPVFRRVDMWGGIDDRALHPEAVAQILKRRAAMAGLTVEMGSRLSPHGLRAGAITQAVINGVPDAAIKEHARHSDIRSTYGYIRRGKLLTESPAKKLGL